MGDVNPYAHKRNLPVGDLEYKLESSRYFKKARVHMLEYGEPEFIFDIPRLVGGGSLLNLGDALGGSAILLSLGLQEHDLFGHVWTVDNYNNKGARQARANYELAGVSHFITQVRGLTFQKKVLEETKLRRYSFIFVDAGHSYEDVYADYRNYSSMLASNGLLAFHDTNQEDIDKVIQAVEADGWERTHWNNRIKCYRRPE